MKTTLELPDPLMRAVKVRAAATDRKIKDVVEELIRDGLAAERSAGQSAPGTINIADYIGKWPRYKSIDEVTEYVRELRKDRDED